MAACQGDASPPPQHNHHPSRYPSSSPSPSINLLCAVALSLARTLEDGTLSHWGSGPDAARLAAILLGASLTLMLCGSATFLIGLVLLPWVLGLLAALYVAGVVTGVSRAARAVVVAALGCGDRDDDGDGDCYGCAKEDLSPGAPPARLDTLSLA